MAAGPPPSSGVAVTDNTMLHVVYGLFALSFLIGLTSIAAVVIAYLQRGKPLNDVQYAHVEWQIRTFWWGLLFAIIAFVSPFLLGSVIVAILAWGALAVWYVFRIAQGWLRLKDGRAIDDPKALI